MIWDWGRLLANVFELHLDAESLAGSGSQLTTSREHGSYIVA